MSRKLRVFLCHATQDKPAVRELYARLKSEPWIDPWLDEENLLPGQDFDLEIYKATRDADAIIICLSKVSVAKEGYVNKEIRRALDIAQEKPAGTIYVIPLRLDNCAPSFEQLKKLHWVDYFAPDAHERLLKSLSLRADALYVGVSGIVPEGRETPNADEGLDLYRFIKIEPLKNSEAHYPFWIGKYPVTNAQYERFLNAPDFVNPRYWLEFPNYDRNCHLTGNWGGTGANWLREKLRELKSEKIVPRHWKKEHLGKFQPNHPVVGISWYEASAYCEWVFQNWSLLEESKSNFLMKPKTVRLPLESEWIIAAGGQSPEWRYPWDEDGNVTNSLKDILQRANVEESGMKHTTSVSSYPLGKSPFEIMDMTGNVWEWQANFHGADPYLRAIRGGSYRYHHDNARVFVRKHMYVDESDVDIGFRLAALLEFDEDFGF